MSELLKILEGIDKTEAESVNGWWETSIGAQFGAEKLNDIIFCFGELKAQRDELLQTLEEVNEFADYLKEYNVPNDFPTDLPEKINIAIAKAKGEA